MQPLAKILATLLGPVSTTNQPEFFKRKLLTQWSEICGKLSTQLCIARIQQRQIVLGVYDTAWMQELYCMSDLLLTQINRALGENYFTELRFKYTNRPVKINLNNLANHKSNNSSNSQQRKLTTLKLTVTEQATLKKIPDPELRLALQNFLARCKS